MDFSIKYRLMFYISLSVMVASMITFFVIFPETILRMPLMSITENNTVTKEQLDGAKGILEQCVGSE